jgi:2,4-dienoyl-CoA reductase-like NADH-dependent reductase (Old Yellow Enzyme family)/thioredoxin reductase
VGVQAGTQRIEVDCYLRGATGFVGKIIESRRVLKVHKELTRLFQPGRIGGVEVRNRIVMAPMGVGYCTEFGYITDRAVAFYEARAGGGVGLISTGGAYVADIGQSPAHHMGIYDDEHVPGLRRLAGAIKAHGAASFIQLIQPASKTAEVPEALPHPLMGAPPGDLSKEEIGHLVELFIQAARRAKDAGFDGIEIHGAHGYLISQFLSPKTNPRSDEYGGSAAKRARFACEIVRGIKQRLGRDFPIIFRMNGDDYIDGGLTIEEAVVQAPLLVEAGADALSVSAGIFQGYHWQIPTVIQPSGCLTHLAAAVKKVVTVPVITAGKLGNPLIAERVLAEDRADFIALGRPLLADPELPDKAKRGKLEDIRPCIYCNLGCSTKRPLPDVAATCSVNPACGRESEYAIEPALHPKRVMVVGGGLAGMEAARTLAQRGHDVSLYEKEGKLGGQWNIVSSYQPEVAALTEYLARGVDRAGVRVFLNTNVNRQTVEEAKPEAIVVATGAIPTIPEVPGVRGRNVVLAWDVLMGSVELGREVVVIGGQTTALEAACLLAEQGRKVSVVGMREVASRVNWFLKGALKERLIQDGVYLYPGTTLHSISGRGVSVLDKRQMLFLKADTVVLAAGSSSENELAEPLQGLVPEVYTVGDAVEPRDSMDAIHEGSRVGREI